MYMLMHTGEQSSAGDLFSRREKNIFLNVETA